MTDIPETRDSLLAQVQDPGNTAAWNRFADIYRPVVIGLARRRGLQDADAQDLAQRVLLNVAAALPSWQPASPSVRFRHWLLRIAKNETLKFLTRQPRDAAQGGSGVLQLLHGQPQTESDMDAAIELEYRRQLVRRAAQIVRDRSETITWQAFAMTTIDEVSIPAAARALRCSQGTIYAARSRIMRRIRAAVRELEEDDV